LDPLVTAPRLVIAVTMCAAIGAGTAADRPRMNPPLTLGGYRVLAADFHTHSSLWSDATITPWGLVLEAQRQGLDAIAITGHNQVLDSKWGQAFAQMIDGPIVLTGEEMPNRRHHLIAVGIHTTVDSHLSAVSQIDEVHRQGGIAIAAHPGPEFWPAFDQAVMTRLDGAEICHPVIHTIDDAQQHLEQFAARGTVAAIGSSDFHGLGPMGLCRTFVFARDNTAAAILEAVRARRTVVYGRNDKAYGDPALVQLAEADGRLRAAARPPQANGWLDWVSRIAGLTGLLGLIGTARKPDGAPSQSAQGSSVT
jgi:predicted metal-dependent phosphoesterase TrpH